MKKHIGFLTAAIAVIINIFILVWGLTMDGGDEMGYSLIALYAILPLTALVSCIIMALNGFKGAIPVAILLSAAAFLIPFAIFSNFDWISMFFGFVPCLIGLSIGFVVKKSKNKT